MTLKSDGSVWRLSYQLGLAGVEGEKCCVIAASGGSIDCRGEDITSPTLAVTRVGNEPQ